MTPGSMLGLQECKFQNRKYKPKQCFKNYSSQEPLCRFISKIRIFGRFKKNVLKHPSYTKNVTSI